ncbi:uncharacterized protein BDR25DRAFT_386379 [Lindgomyces ingoldianus]|uniref:Uncharacterized protein n=1 Tax=Lindgomyces ingoldianus TaxID=673940 RepID=A0ACB6R5J4_9PLEO|nr:uncharacterized protein BDR25DRAFT_386379 [Lindgomyces ingoldianus]KAF2473585.1 hypothetical protein BDR25DRAFT_386379 [Lindgomyces ingoldianus]
MVVDRRFVRTEKGYFGFWPAECREADIVAVVSGGSMPYVLRPTNGGYMLVGDPYVHGIMDGEAFKGAARGSKELRIFVLV